ncbi:TetR-like C-terminal domain-containing protein [uncultured Intestinimonas sp.]|uniref:TetR-like C-terminal domain-containing protein n=1 Tax=uncultured Intestinimonas sp. TaxID=1689265 RepID=UPI003447CA95
MSSLEVPGPTLSAEELTLLRAFLSFGGGGVLATWINSGMKQSPKEIADLLDSYIVQILKLYQH